LTHGSPMWYSVQVIYLWCWLAILYQVTFLGEMKFEVDFCIEKSMLESMSYS